VTIIQNFLTCDLNVSVVVGYMKQLKKSVISDLRENHFPVYILWRPFAFTTYNMGSDKGI
jgi:hypothetical protein